MLRLLKLTTVLLAGLSAVGSPMVNAQCPDGIIDGDYTIETSADAEAIAGCTTIPGSLSVRRTELVTLNLPALVSVGGLSVFSNDSLTSIDLPALTSVGDDLVVRYNDALPQCLVDELIAQIEAVEDIGGEIHTYDNREEDP